MNQVISSKVYLIPFAMITVALTASLFVSSCSEPTATSVPDRTDSLAPVTTTALASANMPAAATGITLAPTYNMATVTYTVTAIDSRTPSYSRPVLIRPADKATFTREQSIEFSWHWDGDLLEDLRYDLRIWRAEKPCCTIAIAWKEGFPLASPPDGYGDYVWQVAVVRVNKDDIKTTLVESDKWTFAWSDAPTLTTSPVTTSTPTLTVTPTLSGTLTHTPTPTPTLTSTPVPIVPTVQPDARVTGLVRLYSGPGPEYESICTLPEGTVLNVLRRVHQKDDWIKIAINPDSKERTEGYVNISSGLIELNAPPEKSPPIYEFGPKLLEPEPSVQRALDGVTMFKWEDYGVLEEHQYYSLIIYRTNLSPEGSCYHDQFKAPEALLTLKDYDLCAPGVYYWGVGVASKILGEDGKQAVDPEGRLMWRDDSENDHRDIIGLDVEPPHKPEDNEGDGELPWIP